MLPIELAQLLDQLQEIVLSVDLRPTPVLIFANRSLGSQTGYDLSTLTNDPKAITKIIHPDDWQKFSSLLTSDLPALGKLRLVCKNGTATQMEGSFTKGITGAGIQVVLKQVQNVVSGYSESEVVELVAEAGRSFAHLSKPAEVFQHLGDEIAKIDPTMSAILIAGKNDQSQTMDVQYLLANGNSLNTDKFPEGLLTAFDTFSLEPYADDKFTVIPSISENTKLCRLLCLIPGNDPAENPNLSALVLPIHSGAEVVGFVAAIKPGYAAFSTGTASLYFTIIEMVGSILKAIYEQGQLTEAYDRTIEGWGQAVEIRDHETNGHSLRVADLSVKLAMRLGLEGDDLVNIRRGALMHDIGKLGVPDSILLKAGPLEIDEIHEMRKHPQYAYDMLKNISFMKNALEIPYSHHERWDGTGYPQQLKGKQIPLAARIFSVVDVYDSMLSAKPYRRPWSIAQVIEYVELNAGSIFDPDVAKVFLEMLIEERDERRRQ